MLPSQDWKRSRHDEAWYAGDTIVVGIGQGFMLATPLQLAHATAALAMNGRPFRPRLAYSIDRSTAVDFRVDAAEPQPSIEIQDPTNWTHVVTAMTEVVHGDRGTARRIAQGLNYRVAGKTGTAQVFSLADTDEYDASKLARKLHDHALFVAFAPADDPLIAVAVIAEHAGGGSSVAAPIARQVLDGYLLEQLQIDGPYQTAAIVRAGAVGSTSASGGTAR